MPVPEYGPKPASTNEVPASGDGLFYDSVFRAPIAWAGFVFVAMIAWGRGVDSSRSAPMLTEEPLAGMIDLAIGTAITFAIAGIVPALIRRKMRSGYGSQGKPLGSRSATGVAFLAAFAIGLGFMLVGEAMADSAQPAVSSSGRSATTVVASQGDAQFDERRCQRDGTDEYCIRVPVFSRSDTRITTDWNYSPARQVSGESLTRITWAGTINCVTRTSRLESLIAYSGSRTIFLPDFAMSAMREGVRNDQLAALVQRVC